MYLIVEFVPRNLVAQANFIEFKEREEKKKEREGEEREKERMRKGKRCSDG